MIEQNIEIKQQYPSHSAGRLAISAVPIVKPNESIAEITARLEKDITQFETINYIYVVDSDKKMMGVLSIKDILRQPKSVTVNEVMIRDFYFVHPYTDQERVALLALKNNIKAVPVVDKQGIFLGVVPSDTILSVLYTEGMEDSMHLAGMPSFTAKETFIDLPLKKMLWHRLPWLLLGLLGGVLSAEVVGLFEGTLSENLILASFIPMIMYMGGAVLSQTQAFFIRDLALNPQLNFRKYFVKQLGVIGIIALSVSVVMLIISLLRHQSLAIANVLSIALLAVVCSTMLTSLVIPYIFQKFKFDPADGSGPMSTVVQDLLGVIIYFLVAYLLL
jgi:magnesium transporter